MQVSSAPPLEPGPAPMAPAALPDPPLRPPSTRDPRPVPTGQLVHARPQPAVPCLPASLACLLRCRVHRARRPAWPGGCERRACISHHSTRSLAAASRVSLPRTPLPAQRRSLGPPHPPSIADELTTERLSPASGSADAHVTERDVGRGDDASGTDAAGRKSGWGGDGSGAKGVPESKGSGGAADAEDSGGTARRGDIGDEPTTPTSPSGPEGAESRSQRSASVIGKTIADPLKRASSSKVGAAVGSSFAQVNAVVHHEGEALSHFVDENNRWRKDVREFLDDAHSSKKAMTFAGAPMCATPPAHFLCSCGARLYCMFTVCSPSPLHLPRPGPPSPSPSRTPSTSTSPHSLHDDGHRVLRHQLHSYHGAQVQE